MPLPSRLRATAHPLRCTSLRPLLRVVLPAIFPLLLSGLQLPAGPASPATSLAAPQAGRILVGLADGADASTLGSLNARLRAEPVRLLDGAGILILDAPDVGRALAAYAAHPATAWVEADRLLQLLPARPAGPTRLALPSLEAAFTRTLLPDLAKTASSSASAAASAIHPSAASPQDPSATYPDDPLFDLQWHHATIGSAKAWDFGRAHEITIAVIDTGVQCDHPDLEGVCVEGYDYFNDDPDPSDDHMHGTIEAGVAAAATHNARGVAGLAWGAKVMPLKAMGGNGSGSLSAIISSIEHAVDHGAQVINMSLGAAQGSPAMQAAVSYAAAEGVFMAAAGGNMDQRGVLYPAAYPEVVGVAGSKPDDSHPPFNTGPHIEVTAPGWDILTSTLGGGYERYHGTSEATPLVAGLAALLIEQHPEWTVSQVRQRIIDSSIDLGAPGWDEVFGWGRIDAGRAMDPDFVPEARPTAAPTGSPTASAPETPNPNDPGSPSPSPGSSPAQPLYLPWLQGG